MSENPLGLRENPFRAGHHPKYVFPSREHQEALAHLRYGIQNREPFVLITGEVGTGKTTAVYDALAEWGSRATVALITNPALTRSELLEEICLRFGVAAAAPLSKPHALVQLERQLSALRARGELAILLLDEAQNLDRELLEEIRLLSNLEVQGEKLLQIFLVAQPELEAKLARPELRQLRQRIGIHYRIQPLGAAETTCYIHHRVAAAGGSADELFTADACAEIFRITNGIPREINLVAGQALLNAFVEDSRSVTAEHVRAVEREIEFQSVLSHRAEAVAPEQPSAPGLPSASAVPTPAGLPDAAPPAAVDPMPVPPVPAVSSDDAPPIAPAVLPDDGERMTSEGRPAIGASSAMNVAAPLARPGTPVLRAPEWPPVGISHTTPPTQPAPPAAPPAHDVSTWEAVPASAFEREPSTEPRAFVAEPPAPRPARDIPFEPALVADEPTSPAIAPPSSSECAPPEAPAGGPATEQPASLLPAWFDEVLARAGAMEEQTTEILARTESIEEQTTVADSVGAPASSSDLAPPASGSDLAPVPAELGPLHEEPARSRLAGFGLLIATMVIATVAIGALLLVRFGSWTRQAQRPLGALTPAPAAVAAPAPADSAPSALTSIAGSSRVKMLSRPATASPTAAAPSPSRSAPVEKPSTSAEPVRIPRPVPVAAVDVGPDSPADPVVPTLAKNPATTVDGH